MSTLWKKTSGTWSVYSTWSKIWKKTSGIWNNVYNKMFAIITAGVINFSSWTQTGTYSDITMNSGSIQLGSYMGTCYYDLVTGIDVTSFNTVSLKWGGQFGGATYLLGRTGINGTGTQVFSIQQNFGVYSSTTMTVDISAITGIIYFRFRLDSSADDSSYVDIYDLKLY